MSTDFSKNLDRADTPDKCAGKTRYVHDMHMPGMLYATTVRSTVRRARILSIGLPELPPGYFCVGAEDIPGENHIAFFRDSCPFFAPGRVNYIGEPVMLLAGENQDLVRQLAGQIQIEYEEIAAIRTMKEALEGEKPPLFGTHNVYVDEHFGYGDVDAAFARAADVFETTTRTGYQEHLYLEPQGALVWEEKGRINAFVSTQGPHVLKKAIAAALGMDENRVRVVQTPVGGGFGGKIETPMILACQAAVAVRVSGRPVRLLYTRQEDMLCSTKRHPSQTTIRSALDSSGNILAVDVDMLFQAGGYSLSCAMVLDTGVKKATGVYHFPAARVRGRALATNNPMPGAFRGFGGPQAFFGIEAHINALARRLKKEPLDIKSLYFIQQGDSNICKGRYHFPVSISETVKAAVEASDYYGRKKAFLQKQDPIRRGLGQALINFGAPSSVDTNTPMLPRHIGVLKRRDGTVEILSELVEMGQGLHTALRKIVARTLELPVEKVVCENADTDSTPFLSITGASMSIVLFGQTLRQAALKLKPRLNEPGEIRILEQVSQPDHVRWNASKMQGEPFHSYSWATFVAEVEVDLLTWQVRTTGLWVALDVGTAIDRRLVQGQIEGGAVQGLGFGLLESMPADGFTASLTDYLIPSFLDAPRVCGLIVETPYPPGPYGAKCAGEPPVVGVGAAIADAVANACGVEIWQLPITPEYLMQQMIDKV